MGNLKIQYVHYVHGSKRQPRSNSGYTDFPGFPESESLTVGSYYTPQPVPNPYTPEGSSTKYNFAFASITGLQTGGGVSTDPNNLPGGIVGNNTINVLVVYIEAGGGSSNNTSTYVDAFNVNTGSFIDDTFVASVSPNNSPEANNANVDGFVDTNVAETVEALPTPLKYPGIDTPDTLVFDFWSPNTGPSTKLKLKKGESSLAVAFYKKPSPWGHVSPGGCVGDFDGDGKDEILVTSSWGIGILKLSGDSMTSLAMVPNGNRIGDWLLEANNNFGPVGDFDFDGKDEILITSPWGLAFLKLNGSELTALGLTPNGTDLALTEPGVPQNSPMRLNTATDKFGPVLNADGVTTAMFYKNNSGVGLVYFQISYNDPKRNTNAGLPVGTVGMLHLFSEMYLFGAKMLIGWTFNPSDKFGPLGDFNGAITPENDSGLRNQIVVAGKSGLAIIQLGDVWNVITTVANGTRLPGGWVLDTGNNSFTSGTMYGYSGSSPYPNMMDVILVTSPWGVGTLWLGTYQGPDEVGPSTPNVDNQLVAGWGKPYGTTIGGGWKLGAADQLGPVGFNNAPVLDPTPSVSYIPQPNFIVAKNETEIGILQFGATGAGAIVKAKYGTALKGGWKPQPADTYGPTGSFDGSEQNQVFVVTSSGIVILKINLLNQFGPNGPEYELITLVNISNGTRLGGWVLETGQNQF